MPLKAALLALIVLAFGKASAADLTEPTRVLNGTVLTYDYTTGRSYQVKIEEKGVSYRYLSGSKPDAWWGPFPYTAFEVEKDEFMLSWFEEGYGDYVTLLVNFKTKLIYGSAILRGEEVHFHGARLKSVQKQ